MSGPYLGTRCTHWIGAEQRHCGATDGVRPFLVGACCPAHTPNALRGLPEVPPGPGLPAGAWQTLSPLAASAVFDERAIASGKRRAHPTTYKAARAAVDQRKATP